MEKRCEDVKLGHVWVIPDGASNGEGVWEVVNGGPAQTIPPSFKQGVDLGTLKAAIISSPTVGAPMTSSKLLQPHENSEDYYRRVEISTELQYCKCLFAQNPQANN
ncbi:hypothetical protein LguiB_019744 [Lonicera macranthoides]